MQDQSVIARTVAVAQGRFAPGHLGELTQLVPFEMVDEAVAATQKVQERIRDLPSRVVVYLLLAACLFPEVGYPGVWRKLTAGLGGIPTAAPTAGALAQARRRLGAGPLRWLFDLLRGPAATPRQPGTWWRGLQVCAIDGTTLTVPDSSAVETRFCQQRGNHGGTGYPQLRLLALVACGTRTLIDAVFGPTTAGETTYAPTLLRSLRPGMILLADRNFGAQGLCARIAGTGADLLVRLKNGRVSRFIPCGVWEAVHLIEGLLSNESDIQPDTVHADTQGQSLPVFALATLFGFDLMPRIRNFQDLIFFRPARDLTYPHIDALFGEPGRNVVDWKLIERHWRDLMQVAISISDGRLSSATLMRRLRSNSRKNRLYQAFREVGRSVRTVALLRYLADPQLRVRVTAATNKVESYNGFAKWLGFGNSGVLADNDPDEQEKLLKFNTLLANLVIFHNAIDIMNAVRYLVADGWSITADQLAGVAPYLRAHISRFGAYATDEIHH